MRLNEIRTYLKKKEIAFQYYEEDDCGSIEFEYRGLRYHVWEYPAPERGAQSNVRTAGRSEEFDDDYEKEILRIISDWEGME